MLQSLESRNVKVILKENTPCSMIQRRSYGMQHRVDCVDVSGKLQVYGKVISLILFFPRNDEKKKMICLSKLSSALV